MSELDDLIAACVAAPEDDAPRLVWADAVGGERGEFVVIQCRLAREDLPPAERGALIARHDELLVAHGMEWSGFGFMQGARGFAFRRGFVEAAHTDATQLPLAEVLRHAPLLQTYHLDGINQSIDYRESTEPDRPHPLITMEHFFAQPERRRLRGIELDGASLYETTGDTEWDFDSTSYGDPVCELVARTQLAGLRGLAFHDAFTPSGMHHLLKSDALATVESLAFQFCKADAAQVAELFAATPRLRSVDLHMSFDLENIAYSIPTSVVELRVFGAGDAIPILARSPVARSLERLEINGSNLGAHTAALSSFSSVRALDARYARANLDAFASLSLPALRELVLFHEASDRDALNVADAFGAQLECLDVLGRDDMTCVEELRTKVAGFVRAGKYRKPHAQMHVGINTREPWAHYGLINSW